MSKNNHNTVYAGTRIVGTVRNGTFHKTVKSSHFLRQPPALAFDIDSLAQAERLGASRVEVFNKETGEYFKATIAHIREAGFALNRGYGEQIALPLNGFIHQSKGGALPVQLSMFGGVK